MWPNEYQAEDPGGIVRANIFLVLPPTGEYLCMQRITFKVLVYI